MGIIGVNDSKLIGYIPVLESRKFEAKPSADFCNSGLCERKAF